MTNHSLANRFTQFLFILVCYLYSIDDSIAQRISEKELIAKDSIARKLIFTDAHRALKLAQENYEYSQNNTVSNLVKAHFMITLGGAYNVSGDYVNSIDITLASILLFEQIDDGAGLIRGYNTLGDIYYHIGEFDKTIRYTKKALEVAESKGFVPFTSNILNNLGGAYRQIKEYEQALEYAQKSVKVATETKQFIVLTYALSTVGEIYYDLQNYDSALFYLQKALSSGVKHNSSTKLSDAFCNYEVGLCYWKQNKLEKALATTSYAYQLCKSNGFTRYQKDASELLSKIWLAKNQLDSAVHYQNISLELKDGLWTIQKDVQLNRTIVKHRESEILTRKEESERQKLVLTGILIIGGLLVFIVFVLYLSWKKVTNQNEIISVSNTLLTSQTTELEHLHQVKDKMFSMVVHDFKTPINSLESLFSLIINKFVSIEEAADLAKQMQKDLQLTKSSIDNMIIWAKSQMQGIEVKPEPIEALKLFSGVKEYHIHQAQKKEIEINVTVGEQLIFESDVNILTIILNNLTSNAIKFSNPKGTVNLSAIDNGTSIVLEVKDDGIGISEKMQPIMFDVSNYSTDGTAAEKGTGLGLLICKELVDLLEGIISVTSNLGKGTSFIIELPINR